MHFLIFILSLNFISVGFSQVDTTPKIDLTIIISNQDTGLPIVGAKVILIGSDGLNLVTYTDSTGTVKLLPGDSLCIKPNNTYTIEVEGVLPDYLGTADAFSTNGITQNIRMIRELKVLRFYHRRTHFPYIHFENSSYSLSTFSLDSLSYLKALMIEHPALTVEIAAIYDSEKEKRIALKRAEVVKLKLIEMGIPEDRFSVNIIQRSDSHTLDPQADVEFRILSLDYVPKP